VAFAFGALLAPVSLGTETTHDTRFGAPSLTSVTWGGVNYTRVSITGAPSGGNAGEPRLPAGSAWILIPYGEEVTGIQVTGDPTLVGTGYVVEPNGKPFAISRGPTEENTPQRDMTIYGSSDPFPAARYLSLGTQGFRGYDILVLRLAPCKYIPTSGALYYYPTLHITVQSASGSGRNALLRGLAEDRTAAANRVDNSETITSYPTGGARDEGDYDLLILTTEAYESAFAPLATAHNNQNPATLTQVHTLDPGVTWQNVRSYIRDEYNGHHIKFALIGAGDNALPAPKLTARADETVQMPSDFYLGCLDGEYDPANPYDSSLDLLAEVYIGRAAADSISEVDNFVNKTIAYTSGQHNHLERVLQAAEWIGWGGDAEYGGYFMDQLIDGWGDTYGISSSTFDIDRLYDAAGPPEYRWPMQALITRMNAGVHWINHLGHARADFGMRVSSRAYPTT
jgi:hypothetical protein